LLSSSSSSSWKRRWKKKRRRRRRRRRGNIERRKLGFKKRMELVALNLSTKIPRQKPTFLSTTTKTLLFRNYHYQLRRRASNHFRFQARNKQQQQLLISQIDSESELEFDSDEDEDEMSSGLLSLSVKPDRNTALLDDYEIEELAFHDSSNSNHRSGQSVTEFLFYYY